MSILASLYVIFLFVVYVPIKQPSLQHDPIPRFSEEISFVQQTSSRERRMYASLLDV